MLVYILIADLHFVMRFFVIRFLEAETDTGIQLSSMI